MNTTSPPINRDEAERFLAILYGEDAPGFLTIWTKSDKQTHWISAKDRARAAMTAAKLAKKDDVYFGVGLQPRELGHEARGRGEDVVALPGLWIDLDIAGAGHADKRYPPDEAAAREFLESLPLKPTLIVHSGGGLHAYWLFTQLWDLTDPTQHQLAVRLSRGWQSHIQKEAAQHGWKLDSTSDLARVLRVAGTINRKGEPLAVQLLEVDETCRYEPNTFFPFAAPAARKGRSKQPQTSGEFELARDLLWELSADRAEAYDDWLKVGMALHSVDKRLLNNWARWSHLSPKYEAGACGKKWDGFKTTQDGLGLGSLIRWAIEDRPWPELIPLRLRVVPDFPVDALPDWLGRFVLAVAEFTQTPVDLAGMLGMALLSTACARKYEIEVRPNYVEPLNLYLLVAQESGTRKSAVFKIMIQPIQLYESTLQESALPEIIELAQHKRVLEGRVANLERDLSKQVTPEKRQKLEVEAQELNEEKEFLVVPNLPRIIVDDATPEELARQLAAHGERIAVLSAEGHVFSLIAGRYSNSMANLDVYVKGHAGDEIIIDRVGRPSERIRRPAITMGLTVQPFILAELGKRPDFRGVGLIARYLFAIPLDLLGSRKAEGDLVPDEAHSEFKGQLAKLLKLRADEFDPNPDPTVLRLSPEAHDRFTSFVEELEPRFARGADLAPIRDWAGKLAGAVARIAGLLHLAEHPEQQDPECRPVTAGMLERAIQLGWYLLAHAQKAFDVMAANPTLARADRVLDLMKTWGEPTVKVSEIYARLRSVFPRTADVYPAVDVLVDHAYLRPLRSYRPPGMAGRPESPAYLIRPDISAE